MPSDPMLSTVLVVEEDALVRMHGVDTFQEAGFRVLEAADADEAIAILGDAGEVFLLFSEVGVPGGMDGLALARLVHARWPRVHLLLTSGHHRLRDVDVPGAGRFVRKPWTSEGLVGHVRAFAGP